MHQLKSKNYFNLITKSNAFKSVLKIFFGTLLFLIPAGAAYSAIDLRVSGNQRYLEDSAGNPFLYLADTEWVLNKHSNENIISLLDDRKAKGFTVIQFFAVRNWASATWGTPWLPTGQQDSDFNGQVPFVGGDFSNWNNLYWNRWVWIAEQCAARNLKMALHIGGYWQRANPTWVDPDINSNNYKNRIYEYGRKVGEFFGDKTNIIFTIGQDRDAYGQYQDDSGRLIAGSFGPFGPGVDGWRAMAEGVADGVNGVNNFNNSANYSNTFMTFHPTDTTSSEWFHGDEWLDMNGMEIYGLGPLYNLVNGDYNKTSPVKPTAVLEANYEADYLWVDGKKATTPTPAHYVRTEAYYAFFGGGAGYAYGHRQMYAQSSPLNINYINSEGAQQMKVLKDFMTAPTREWWKFVPYQAIFSSGEGSGDTRKVAVRSTDGDECYVYFPERSTAGIKMNCLTTGATVEAKWFDPRNGNTQSIGTYATSQTVSLTPPAGWEDALLMLNASAAPPYCGDNSCNGTENCSSCPGDCGICPSQNPVGWWKFDETSGNTAADASGNGNNGTLVNGPVWIKGQVGNALSFDGVNDAVTLPLSTSLNVTNQLSISAWVNTRNSAAFQRIIEHGAISTHPYYEYVFVVRDGKFALGLSDGSVLETTSNGSIPNNTWTHIVGTWDGTSIRYYINGNPDGLPIAKTGPIAQQNNKTTLGYRFTTAGEQYFNGSLDDVRIYNRTLSAAEAQALYRAGAISNADVNGDGQVNIKDIQICIKAITAPDSFTTPDQLNQLSKCKAVAPPDTIVNIKDIQAIVRVIINP